MKTHSTLFFFTLVLGALSSFAEMSDAKLKERLTDGLLRYMVQKQFFSEPIEDVYDPFSHELKEVTDEQFHRVLMEIYNEAEEKLLALTPNTPEWEDNKYKVIGVLVCLPLCGEIPVKEFLLEYAASQNNDSFNRAIAVASYLRTADTEEMRDVLLRFLIGDERMGDDARSSLYLFAKDEWDSASPDKKAAIVQAFYEAASSESTPWVFEECDSRLLLMVPAWRDSPRRKSMLERQLTLQFSKYYTDLKSKMEKEVRRISLITKKSTVSTKAAAAPDISERLSPLASLTNGTATTIQERVATESAKGEAGGRNLSRIILLCLSGILLLGFGTWRFIRR